MKQYKKAFSFLTAALTFAVMTAGCSNSKSDNSGSSSESVSETEPVTDDSNESVPESSAESSGIITLANNNFGQLFSDRDMEQTYGEITDEIRFDGDKADITGSGASSEDAVVTITKEGVYHITGKSANGQIVVNAPQAKVQLVLDNADIANEKSSVICIQDADKTFITLAPDSENFLSDGENYSYPDDTVTEPDAAVFSEDSLTINGTGSLTVNGNYNDGIRCKDDIVITGGNLNITAVSDGIKGKDYVAAAGGIVTVNSGQDGVKSTNKTDTSKGFIYICGGTFNITAAQDGFQAETSFIADGGEFNIIAGGGNANSTKTHNDDFGAMHGGYGFGDFKDFGQNPPEYGEFPEMNVESSISFASNVKASESDTSETVSTKGIKGLSEIIINGGTFTIDSADDAIHSNGSVTIAGGTSELSAGDKGIHGDSSAEISDGTVKILTSYEGIEASSINICGGELEIRSSDDGFNASDGSTSQKGMGTYTDGVQINISGGYVYVDADGDGLDSNGDMTISGGTVLVDGPVNGANGALDGNGEITVSGGLLIAAGSAQMAEVPGDSSSQNVVGANVGSCGGGTLVTLADSGGKEILSYAPSKDFEHIVISSPDIKSGESYTVYTGGSSDSTENHGLYETSGYKNDGTEAGSFTAENVVSTIGSQGMGGFGGFGGRNPGDDFPEMPDGFDPGQMQPPSGDDGRPEMPEGFDPEQMPERPDKKNGYGRNGSSESDIN